MNYPRRAGMPASTAIASQAATPRWTARRPIHPIQAQPNVPQRRYEALSLLSDGTLAEISRRAPAHPLFESAFGALARGTLLATEEGPVAIEDMLPGMKVETRDDGFQRVRWIGTITLVPSHSASQMPMRLFRVPVDSFGPSRPMPDLMLAPHARLLHRSPRLREMVSNDSALAPVTAFEDGQTVIRVAPVSPVSVYHLAFRDHHILRANGLEIESYHPGEDLYARLGGENLKLFQSFFPHMTSLTEFGPLSVPRISLEDFAALS